MMTALGITLKNIVCARALVGLSADWGILSLQGKF